MEKEKQLVEMMKLKSTILKIEAVLNTSPMNLDEARKLIYSINDEHSENIVWNSLLHAGCQGSGSGKGVLVSNAQEPQLRCDLEWKYRYLSAKLEGKTSTTISSLKSNL